MSGVLGGLIAAFPTPVTSSFESIATQTLGSTTSSITFSSIPSTYSSLQIRFMSRVASGSQNVATLFYYLNGDTTSANYYSHRLYGTGSSANAFSSNSNQLAFSLETYSTTTFGAGIIDIQDYASTAKTTTTRVMTGFDTNSGPGGTQNIALCSSLWNNTSAVNSITLYSSTGSWAANSTFALYGIKG